MKHCAAREIRLWRDRLVVEPGAAARVECRGLRGHVEIVPRTPPPVHSQSIALSLVWLMKNGKDGLITDEQTSLDAVDHAILGELAADGRISLAELGRRVSLSPLAVAERVRRLEQARVITGYHADIDPRALGY